MAIKKTSKRRKKTGKHTENTAAERQAGKHTESRAKEENPAGKRTESRAKEEKSAGTRTESAAKEEKSAGTRTESAAAETQAGKRAGGKSTAEKQASITIEAALAVPLFLFALVSLLYLLELKSLQISLVSAAQYAAKSAAEDTAVLAFLDTGGLEDTIAEVIGESRLSRSILDGGSDAIDCSGSYLSSDGREMNIIVEYRIKLPLASFASPSFSLTESFRLGTWRGYQADEDDEDESRIVYITETGSVWHADYQCTYLQPSISYVTFAEVESLRNASGSRYSACEKCVVGSGLSGVYITDYGTKYHSSLSCSGLKRTIYAVKLSEVGSRSGCSKCSGE